jgi:hypothetical protein
VPFNEIIEKYPTIKNGSKGVELTHAQRRLMEKFKQGGSKKELTAQL